MRFFHTGLNMQAAGVRSVPAGGRYYVAHTVGDDEAPRRLCVRNDDLLTVRSSVEGFDEEVGRNGKQDFLRCAGSRWKTPADNVLPPIPDIDDGMAVPGKAAA